MSKKKTLTVFKSGGKYGIEENGGLVYDADFDSRQEAQAVIDAHDAGAETYEDTKKLIAKAKASQ